MDLNNLRLTWGVRWIPNNAPLVLVQRSFGGHVLVIWSVKEIRQLSGWKRKKRPNDVSKPLVLSDLKIPRCLHINLLDTKAYGTKSFHARYFVLRGEPTIPRFSILLESNIHPNTVSQIIAHINYNQIIQKNLHLIFRLLFSPEKSVQIHRKQHIHTIQAPISTWKTGGKLNVGGRPWPRVWRFTIFRVSLATLKGAG